MAKIYGAEVSGVGKCLPKKFLTNDDLTKFVDTSDEWITTRTGIKQRHMISEDESVSQMSSEAAQQALNMAGVSPEDVGLIICGTFTADFKLPSAACLIQDRIGATKAGAFDINSACTGFIHSLITGAQYVKTGAYKHVLVIGADACSRSLNWEDRATCVLFGDGASAVLLSQNENPKIGVQSHFTRTDGGGMRSLWIYAGGSDRPIDEEVLKDKLHYVQMSGSDVFKFAIQAISESANKVMEQEGLEDGDIRLMVPHQANKRIIQAAAKKLNIPSEQVYVNIDRYGNTVGASVGLALCDAYHENRLSNGDKVLVVGFGAGLSWGATVINWSLS